MGLMKPKVSSYVDRGNELIAKGKTKQAMNLVSHGLQYYSERVIDSISPYAKKCVGKPSLQEIEKTKKPNRR